ncbi:MAG TPA: hypothetical protein VFE18_01380 [Phenylobacterium sp.]|uniref:hypothetical protein n=1 Tax=Phenylobacterium sp. TaxID=1871053 RepID=UPI002D30A61D|nr:hypothetical protein [Phenylobacterium sp.]HZZ66801.1 hypothetical protein [Phenylobacterium sp.]
MAFLYRLNFGFGGYGTALQQQTANPFFTKIAAGGVNQRHGSPTASNWMVFCVEGPDHELSAISRLRPGTTSFRKPLYIRDPEIRIGIKPKAR